MRTILLIFICASWEYGHEILDWPHEINSSTQPALHIYAAFKKEKKNIKRKKNTYMDIQLLSSYMNWTFFSPVSNHGLALSSN